MVMEVFMGQSLAYLIQNFELKTFSKFCIKQAKKWSMNTSIAIARAHYLYVPLSTILPTEETKTKNKKKFYQNFRRRNFNLRGILYQQYTLLSLGLLGLYSAPPRLGLGFVGDG